jgi:putative transposase
MAVRAWFSGDSDRVPRVQHQRWVHKMRNILEKVRKSDYEGFSELLSFFVFPCHLWRKLRTTIVIERRFVEVRRRTRPMVCFVNVENVDRIIYSIFQRFNLEWKTRTLNLFTSSSTSPHSQLI